MWINFLFNDENPLIEKAALPLVAGAAIGRCASTACRSLVTKLSKEAYQLTSNYLKTYFIKTVTDQGVVSWKTKEVTKSADTYGTPLGDPDDWDPDKKFEKHNDFDRKTCKYKDSEGAY